MLVLGEVRTCLLHNATPLPTPVVAQVLALVPGRRVLSTARPVARSVSPDQVTGVDCRLATATGGRARGVGTVASRAIVTAGLIVQGSASARLRRAGGPKRLAWSHYAGRPGVIDVMSQSNAVDLAAGYLSDLAPEATLDLGSVSERVIGDVQRDPRLDHVTSVRSRTTWVRWAARLGDSDTPAALVRSEDDVVRTIELTVGEGQFDLAARFCEDFAVHDWLLTTLGQVIDHAERLRAGGREPTDVLRSAVERLLHLWMPGAHLDPALAPLWEALERRPGFSRQWNAQVDRIRDQIALETLQALDRARRGTVDW
jgi:hypothetical protein